ncbi:AsmA-like C-terminal region-containing protein [Methylobacterium sp. A49B]
MADETTSACRPRGRARRVGGVCLVSALALVLLLGAGIGVVAVRLSNGPLQIDGLSRRVATAVAERIGPGWSIGIRGSSLELDRENALRLRFSGLDIRNPQGALVVRAPLALVSLDLWSLLRLNLQPRSIEFRETQTTALVHRDGSIAFAASEANHPVDIEPVTPPSVDGVRGSVSPLSAAIASIFGVVLDSSGVVGALDRARVTDARLRLIDEDGHERAVFSRVNGLFGRDPVNGTRNFELRLDGPHGEWRFGGSLRDGGEGRARSGVITLDDLPVTDLLLLSGQSGLPLTTDLKVSARADVSLSAGRIQTMSAKLHTGDGTFLIEEKDFNPVTVESLDANLTWDEAGRVMELAGLDYRGAGNAVHLTGAWKGSPPDAGTTWTATLASRDATLRGATSKDAPVKIGALDAQLSGRDGGIAIDALTLSAPGVSGTITGTIGTSADDGGLTLHIVGHDGEVRTGLRLWPEHIAPPARTYLVDQLRRGRVDSVDIRVKMSGTVLAAATRGEPAPDDSVHIDFHVSDAAIDVTADAPPVTKGNVVGTITGRSTTVRNVTAEVHGPDGRGLAISDGNFVIPQITPDRVVAQIGMRLSGGADGMASVLQAKLFKSVMSVDLDPATIKGSADLRVDFPLDLKHIPDLPDLPVTLTGTLADLSVDKVMGKDRLEAGKFALSYDRGAFALKGDGRVAGAPVSVDMRQPKVGQPGEAVVNLALDDAVRSRKGLPTAPQLTGTIPVRAVVPIGRPGSGKPPIKVEADLARAGIDGLLPGLTKPAGKAGRLTFTLVDNGQSLELRDFALDAAPATARGSVTITPDGGLERADLTSVKLSPGDDLRVSLDRIGSGYKVLVRGAVVDARPFLKSLGAPDPKGGKEAKESNPKDVEADIQLPIVTGFNDEALTSAKLQLSLHGKTLRAANITGRFRSAPFAATVTRERGAPTLAVDAADAGATLRFVDVYRRMYGGRLNAGIGLNDGPQSGVVQIRDFTLRNEPALSSIMAQGPEAADTDAARGRRAAPGRSAGDVTFDRMRANFVRNGTRVDFSDAAISNAAMGFTLSGWLDTGRERTDMNGTFVPLYGLNNVASQLPLLGPLLGGGHNEGLFAVNFRVSGKLASPDVSVNPLSAIAPGFLRKLFSAGGGPFADGMPAVPQQ